MSKYEFIEKSNTDLDTIELSDTESGNKIEIALQGATLLNYFIPLNGELFNIIDGFTTPQELLSGKGARCWIMTPFANRIPNGIYNFNKNTYKLLPISPGTKVMHGISSHQKFEIYERGLTENFIEITFISKEIRPGVFPGYPFSLNVYIKYRLEKDKLSMSVIGENTGDTPLPFFPGWHPYFKTSDKGIDHLQLTVNSGKIILMNDQFIPLANNEAYGNIDNYTELDFRDTISNELRIIGSRILDIGYADLKKDNDGLFRSSIYDPQNGLGITMFQKDGFTIVFSGDSLPDRPRKSIAIEPMRFLTNAFNRNEFIEDMTILPGENKKFTFGVEISRKDVE